MERRPIPGRRTAAAAAAGLVLAHTGRYFPQNRNLTAMTELKCMRLLYTVTGLQSQQSFAAATTQNFLV